MCLNSILAEIFESSAYLLLIPEKTGVSDDPVSQSWLLKESAYRIRPKAWITFNKQVLAIANVKNVYVKPIPIVTISALIKKN